MRLLVHDYSGHPFQVELSRWLAAQGHRVRHVYSAAVETPRGPLTPKAGDPAGFDIMALAEGRHLAKYSPLRRLTQEGRYARDLAHTIQVFAPDAVLCGNCNPLIQIAAAKASHRSGAGFVYWLQDIYAHALRDAVGRSWRLLAPLAHRLGHAVEAYALSRSDNIVAISPPFATYAETTGLPSARVTTIPNWAPPLAKPADDGAAWRAAHGLAGRRFLFVYAGTLGLKHDPERLAALARHFRADPEVAVVVASQGPGRKYLEQIKASESLTNLTLLDFQPYDTLPAMLRAADVLLALLSPAAGGYAVPSKVLTALRAGRPVLASLPPDNLAATTLRDSSAGLLVAPDDAAAWRTHAEDLRTDPDLRARLGAAGESFAASAFDMARIGPRFDAVLRRAAASLAPAARIG